MSSRTPWLPALRFFLTLPLLAGLLALLVSAAQSAPIRVIYGAVAASNTPVWVAQEKDLFKKYGLATQLSHIATTQAVQALLSGDIQFTTASAQIVYADLAGGDAIYIAGLTNHFVFSLYGKAGIKSVADLKGRTIASTQPDEPTTISVRMALSKEGMDPEKDVKFTYLREMPAILGSLSQGVVDAAVMSPPTNLLARELGFRQVIDIAAMKIPFIHSAIAAQRTYVRANPETTRNFLKAIVAALKICREQREDTLAIMAKYTKIEKPSLLEEAYQGFHATWEKIPYVSREGVETILDLSKNPKARAAKPEEFLDNSFLKELETSGFVDALYKK